MSRIADDKYGLILCGSDYNVDVAGILLYGFSGIIYQNADAAQKVRCAHGACLDWVKDFQMTGNLQRMKIGKFCHQKTFQFHDF